jgi:hypothetical protein
MIFLYPPMQDLLARTQRVDHKFHDIIASSVLIQRYLFFAPAPALAIKGTAEFQVNLLFFVKSRRRRIMHNCPATNIEHFEESFLTHILTSYHILRSCPTIPEGIYRTRSRTHPPEYHTLAQPEATWRRMLLTQPPLPSLDTWERDTNIFTVRSKQVTVEKQPILGAEPIQKVVLGSLWATLKVCPIARVLMYADEAESARLDTVYRRRCCSKSKYFPPQSSFSAIKHADTGNALCSPFLCCLPKSTVCFVVPMIW